MKRKGYIIVVLILLFLCALSGLFLFRNENPSCDIKTLILDQEILLEGGETVLGYVFLLEQDSYGAEQAYNIYVEKQPVTASHTLYQYANQSKARFQLAIGQSHFFPAGWQWKELENTKKLALNADAGQIKCGTSSDSILGERCVAVLRYGMYVSDLGVSISPSIMEIADFKNLVIEIDNHFATCQYSRQ